MVARGWEKKKEQFNRYLVFQFSKERKVLQTDDGNVCTTFTVVNKPNTLELPLKMAEIVTKKSKFHS